MKRLKSILLILCLLSAPGHRALAACSAVPLADLLEQSTGTRFAAASPAEIARASALFEAHFHAPQDSASLGEPWQKLGFELHPACAGNELYWVVHEAPQQRVGRGLYAFAQHPRRDTVLQAPHRFHDRHTGDIQLALLAQGGFRAAAWNTVRRRLDDQDADLAHLDSSHFRAYTQALARARPGSRLLQLHGYSVSKRRTEAGRTAQFIVSSGRTLVTEPVRRLHACMAQGFGPGVRLFPATVSELGGTRNRIGEAFRNLEQNGFIHLEINRAQRDQLRADASHRQRLIQCLD